MYKITTYFRTQTPLIGIIRKMLIKNNKIALDCLQSTYNIKEERNVKNSRKSSILQASGMRHHAWHPPALQASSMGVSHVAYAARHACSVGVSRHCVPAA